jgi:hypothetical protein
MAKTASLHELLAVEGDLEGEYKKITAEAEVTFNNKAHLFQGFLTKTKLFDENANEHPSE